MQIPTEVRDAIVWLERRPGVTSVVKGRRTRTSHKHAPGYTTVTHSDARTIGVRLYGTGFAWPMTIHAPRSANRDGWVAEIAGGRVVGGTDLKPRLVKPTADPTAVVTVDVPRPAPMLDNAAQLYLVTPEVALRWLEQNKRNRDVRDSIVHKYAADMLAGRWKVVGDAVQFDTSGSTINGQHRLWAIAESGVSVPLLVMFNCDPESINVMDDHLKRSLKDVAKIRRTSSAVTNVHTAVANMLIQTSIAATLVDRHAAQKRVSRQAQLEALDRHWDAIEFVYHECLRSRKIRGLTVTGVLTPLARAYYTHNHDALRHFGKVLLSGVNEGEADKPIILLRNWLIHQSSGGRPVGDVTYRKTERALHAFLKSETIATLYEASEELFPLPEENMKARKT